MTSSDFIFVTKIISLFFKGIFIYIFGNDGKVCNDQYCKNKCVVF